MMPQIPRAALVILALIVCVPRTQASAQLSDPCGAACASVLGITGLTFATGTLVAYTRLNGGLSTTREGLAVTGVGLIALVGGGVALGGNGERQERAVYAAGLGALAGSAVGLAIEATLGESDGSSRLAASLMGAAAGALAGGVYGALRHKTGRGGTELSFSLSARF